MPGFAQLGSPGFQVAPPRLAPNIAQGNINFRGIPQFSMGQAGFLNPEASIATSQRDVSPEHEANIYLQQMGLGPTRGGANETASDPYGLNPQDWLDVRRFSGNTLDPTISRNYQNLVGRIRQRVGGLPGFSGDQFNRFTNDLPLQAAGSYNIMPPTAMQNWAFWPGVIG